MTSLMPSGGIETFTGTANTTLVGTNFAVPINEGTGGHAQTTGTQGRIRTGTTTGNRTSLRVAASGISDAEMVFEWVVPTASTQFPAAVLRSTGNLNGDVSYILYLQNGAIELNRFSPAFTGTVLATQSYTFTPGVLMKTRIAAVGQRIRMRTWPQANTEVTSSWDMDYTDTGGPTSGYWGFTTSSNTSGSKDFLIDNLNITDTITPSLATITVSGSTTPTGVLTKKTIKTLVGSLTSSGALTKMRVVTRLFTGATTPAGVLKKIAIKGFTGSTTPSGAMKKVVAKKFDGWTFPNGSVRKMTAKRFTGSITSSGTMVGLQFGRIFGRPGIVVITHRIVGEVRTRVRRS
jgi:hypothetical protein